MASEAKIRTVIVDDEAPARSRIRQLLKDQPEFEIIADCSNGRQAVELVQKEHPDLLFLDVQMPRLNGLEVCQTLAANAVPLPMIIFVTAYDDYALKAFEVHALDYLLKPFDRARFEKALSHAREQLRRSSAVVSDSRLTALLEDLRAGTKKPERLVFKQNGRVIFIRTESIDWVEADGNYVRVRAGEEAHYLRETLGSLESQLPPGKFMRISRSVVVNLDRVKELQPLFYGDYSVILRDGSKLNMSRNYRDRLESILARRS
jgi:two-component system LytT family response regulator